FSSRHLKYGAIAVAVMMLYFANKMLSGNLVGHYGSSVHLNFKLAEVVPAFYKYIIKILFLGGFFPVSLLNKLYGWLDKPVVAIRSLFALSNCFYLFPYLQHPKLA